MSDPPTRTALVTGGVRRVGRKVALHLARLGWDVAVTYRTSAEAMSTLAGEFEGMGRQLVPVRADFTDDAAAAKVGDAVNARFAGRLDLLVHNASVYEPGGLDDADAGDLRRNFAVHVAAPLLLTKRLRPALEAAGGAVVCMTDVDLDRGRPSYLAYQVTKAGLANLVVNLAKELAPRVTVNAIAPGAVEWPADLPEDAKVAYLKKVPLGRVADPAEVPALIEFLATRGRYLTGQTFRMDGGRHLR